MLAGCLERYSNKCSINAHVETLSRELNHIFAVKLRRKEADNLNAEQSVFLFKMSPCVEILVSTLGISAFYGQ